MYLQNENSVNNLQTVNVTLFLCKQSALGEFSNSALDTSDIVERTILYTPGPLYNTEDRIQSVFRVS